VNGRFEMGAQGLVELNKYNERTNYLLLMKKGFLLNGFIAVVLMICCGCASIVDGGRRKVTINSNPPGATVTVINEAGQSVETATTPAVVKLERGNGYFRAHQYTVKFDMAGYYPTEVEINSALNGWFFGNLGFGGAIGFLIVDPLTGSMWTLTPQHIDWNLIPTSRNLAPDQLKAAQAEANPVDKNGKPVPAPKSGSVK
jgi:hypothetical protein